MTRGARALVAGCAALLVVVLTARVQRGAPARTSPTVPPVPDPASLPEPAALRIERVELPPDPQPDPAVAAAPSPPEPVPRPDTPRTDPRPVAAAPPPPISPGAEALRRGESRLLEGRFPRLRATYARIGFARYRRAMEALGAAFFIYDTSARRPLSRVDPVSGRLDADLRLDALSVWPRDVTGKLASLLERAREELGPRADRVVLLPPRAVDAALLGGLDDHLRTLGLDPDDVLRVDVAYELAGGRLACQVLAVALRERGERELDLRIRLSGIDLSAVGGPS